MGRLAERAKNHMNHNIPATTTYTLFRKITADELRSRASSNALTISFGNFFTTPKEPWQLSDEDSSDNGKSRETDAFEFICHVKSPKEIAAAVRRAPLHSYVLFQGIMSEVKVAMPVFVDGKSLDTLNAEWGGEESGK